MNQDRSDPGPDRLLTPGGQDHLREAVHHWADIPQIRQGCGARIAPSRVLGKINGSTGCAAGGRNDSWLHKALKRAACPHRGALLPLSPASSDLRVPHAGAGGARSRAISDRISANICRGAATSAIWNVT